MKKQVYVIIALSHVREELQKQEVRDILKWLEESFDVEILMWAWDIESWDSKPVENVYVFDKGLALRADLAIVFFLESEGSDGRGGEIFLRVDSGKPLVSFAKSGVKVSKFSRDALRYAGQDIHVYQALEEIHPIVAAALEGICLKDEASEQLELTMNMADD